MKEIGNILKEKRIENGISIKEAASDLNVDDFAIENVEEGNVRAFKDMYTLKELIKDYAKYLGADVGEIVENFNDFLFDHTSKLSLDDIILAKDRMKPVEKKVISPYTKIPKPKRNYSKIIKPVLIFLVVLLVIIGIILLFKKDEGRSQELLTKMGGLIYEFA